MSSLLFGLKDFENHAYLSIGQSGFAPRIRSDKLLHKKITITSLAWPMVLSLVEAMIESNRQMGD